jgi:hypothetical protein
MAYASYKMISALVADRKEFDGNSMKGRIKTKSNYIATGQMPKEFVDELQADIEAMQYDSILYLVYSYQTVIGWWTQENGWKRPDVKYSVTTSKHQSKIPRSDRQYV